jgi:uncharacterized 2Fe-2S/4Fe-4S cluster protein (DUF4445 family)
MKHFTITIEPEGKQISIHAGATLLEAAGQANIILNTFCGGAGTCEKCIVYISPDNRKVLACQYRVQSNLIVTIPPESRYFEQKILEHGINVEKEFSSTIYEKYVSVASIENIFGIAVDIGTTTVVAKLINLAHGKCHETATMQNLQTRFGDDVISRIAYAESEDKLKKLQKLIIDCINGLIKILCEKALITQEHIFEICAVGNTTMNHIFLGFPVTQLGTAPYQAYSLEAVDLPTEKSGLKINPKGNIHTVENIAGFVGSDTIAAAMVTDIASVDKMTLIVDIGTNGEIVLGNKEKIFAASCAAGPAMEGARIDCGSRAVDGSIEAVVVNDSDIDFDIIGNSPAHSICGSGLIDAVAVMLNLGILDSTGKFTEPDLLKEKLPQAIYARLRENKNEPAFYFNDKVYLSQKDIRQLQLAKAAILAGIKILLEKIDIKETDIEQIFLAGAFGNYIRRESALRVGLLPMVDIERIHFIGNAAASGAQMLLLSDEARQKAGQLAKTIQYIEIAHQTNFQDIFADSLSFFSSSR